ncbi:hypothetical protein Tco_0427596, partial [Tanacetum coccineum]
YDNERYRLDKVEVNDEIMDYVVAKYVKTNWKEDDSWFDIIVDEIWNKFYATPEVATLVVSEVFKLMVIVILYNDSNVVSNLVCNVKSPGCSSLVFMRLFKGYELSYGIVKLYNRNVAYGNSDPVIIIRPSKFFCCQFTDDGVAIKWG